MSGVSSSNATTSITHQAFLKAAEQFASKLGQDDKTRALLQNAISIQDVKKLVEASQSRYQDEKKFQKARKWLSQAISTIHHYSGVIDVFAQVDPLHVSLVWGSLKLVILAAQSHEKTISMLSKALTKIAQSLPRVELATMMYSAEEMRSSVEGLYCNIFEFFSRVYVWYREGSIRRAWHSLVQPPALIYDDIISNIDESSRHIDKLAILGSQLQILGSQLRTDTRLSGMEDSIATILQRLCDMGSTITILSNCQMDTNRPVTDLQFSDMISSLSNESVNQKLLHSSAVLHRPANVLGKGQGQGQPNHFWLSPKLERWTMSKDSNIVFVNGNSQTQSIIRDFSLRVVDQLRDIKVPFLWALPDPDGDVDGTKISPQELLKHLVLQAVQRYGQAPTERDAADVCAQFRRLATEAEWIRMLGSVLEHIGSQVYIVIDLTALDQKMQPVNKEFSWLHAFQELFADLARSQRTKTQIKVLLLSYRSQMGLRISESIPSEFLVPVRTRPVPKHMRHKVQPVARNQMKLPRSLRRR